MQEHQTIRHFQAKLCDVLTKNGLIAKEAFASKRFSLSCKAELMLQQRGQHTTQMFSNFRSELLTQLCQDKQRHVVGAINEFRNKIMQLSDYFNTNRQQAERNFASLPDFNSRARRVGDKLRAELTCVKEQWKVKLKSDLVDMVEQSWEEWGDVARITTSIGAERIKQRRNINGLAPDITRDIYKLFTTAAHKKLKPAVHELLSSMVYKFEETAERLDQPILHSQARTWFGVEFELLDPKI